MTNLEIKQTTLKKLNDLIDMSHDAYHNDDLESVDSFLFVGWHMIRLLEEFKCISAKGMSNLYDWFHKESRRC